MAVFSFRRSTRSSRPFSSGEMMTSGSASRPSSAFHASSSSIGSHSRPFVNTLSARAQLSSSGCSSRRSSRPLSPIPLWRRRWVTWSRPTTSRRALYGTGHWAGSESSGRSTKGKNFHFLCGKPFFLHTLARTSLASMMRSLPHVAANV